MKILLGILKDFKDFFNPTTKRGLVHLGSLIGIAVLLVIVLKPDQVSEITSDTKLRTVTIAPVLALSENSRVNLIGTVEAENEAIIQSETGGQVTAVDVKLGQAVTAGQVIARVENASEYAALLQAEGAYEAAQAAAAQSDISVSETERSVNAAEIALTNTKNSAVTNFKSAFTTFRTILLSDVDVFFSNPKSATPGLRLTAGGKTSFLNRERVEFTELLETWQQEVNTITVNNNLVTDLESAVARLTRLAAVIDLMIDELITEDSGFYTEAELDTFRNNLQTARATLNTAVASLEDSVTSLATTNESFEQAKLALQNAELRGTSVKVSAANAQVKQALGSLRAAQANYNKTILTAPISGTVNLLDVKTGDFISAFTRVATIANNKAFLITAFISEKDRNLLSVGDEVTIKNYGKATVSTISPALDPVTRKIKVELLSEATELSSGQTVTIVIDDVAVETTNSDQPIYIPLSAVKFTADLATVFTVEEQTLIANPVSVGRIQSGSVEIVEGIDENMQIVVDARGLSSGAKVDAVQK